LKFLVDWTVLIDIYPKMTFLRFYRFYWTAPTFWTIFLKFFQFQEISSNQLKDLLNSYLFQQFLDLQKSLPVLINRSINLLPLFVHNCRNEPRLLGMGQMNQDFQEWTRMFRNGPGLSGMNQESSGLRWLSVMFCQLYLTVRKHQRA